MLWFFLGGGGGGGIMIFFLICFQGATTNPQISINTTEGKRLGRGEKKLIARIWNDWAGAGREERRWHTFTFLSILCSSYLALKESTKSIHLLNLCWIFVKCTYFMSLLKVCYQSVFAESLKFYFGLSLHIFSIFFGKYVRLLMHASNRVV